MYVYIKNRKAFLIMPVVGGTEIATDNTCRTFKSLQKFTENVMHELNFMEDLLIVLGKDYSDILSEIVNLKELYSSARSTGIFDNVYSFGYNGASHFLSTTNSMLLDVSINRDNLTSATNHTFSARNGVLGSALRDQIGNIETVKDNIPSIEFFRNNLPNIKITETETSVLQKCKDTWDECNFPSDKWEKVCDVLGDRIRFIKELAEEDDTEFDKEQLTGALTDNWEITFADEINFNSLAKGIFDENSSYRHQINEKTSLLTQFFLATVNIFIKDLKGSCNDFGKSFEANRVLSEQLAIVVKNSLEAGFNTEEKIINFLVEKQIIQTLSSKKINSIKKIFTRQYSTIKESPHFDEFIVLPKNTDSPWFEYGGSLCTEFRYFYYNIPSIRDRIKINKDSYNPLTLLKRYRIKTDKDSYSCFKRNSQNSLQFREPTSSFKLDNIKINLDKNNIENFINLTKSNYNQAHLFTEKIAKNIDFSDNHNKEIIQSLFFYAIEYKNITLFLKTAINGANVNQRNSNGISPLAMAVKCKNIDAINYLVENHANINEVGKNGSSILISSIINGEPEIAISLISPKSDLNSVNNHGDTALHWAAEKGYIEIAQALLNAKANPNIRSKLMVTPLQCAAEIGNIEIVKSLLIAGAKPNVTNKQGDTAIFLAARNGHIEIVKALLEANSDPNIANKSGVSPLFWAIENGNLEIVKALLNSKAKQNIMSIYGSTALRRAINNGHLEIVKALLNADADPNITNENGYTALHWAADNGHIEIVKALLNANADPNITNKNDVPPLVTALEIGNIEIVHALLDAGANPNYIDKKGHTILNKAILQGRIDIAIHLINAGADCNKKYGFFDKPLTLAEKLASERKEELIKVLIENGADTTNYRKINLLVSLVIVSCIAFPAALASTLLLPKLFLILAPIAGLIAITSIIIGSFYAKEPEKLYMNIATTKGIEAKSLGKHVEQKQIQQVNAAENTKQQTKTLEK